MSDEETDCCACMNVTSNPRDNGDGTLSDRWVCVDCGSEYCKRFWADRAEKRIEALEATITAVRDRYWLGDSIRKSFMKHGRNSWNSIADDVAGELDKILEKQDD